MTEDNKILLKVFAVALPCVALFAIAVGLLAYFDATHPVVSSSPKSAPVESTTGDKSSDVQAKRKQAVDEMINDLRIFSKVERVGEYVHVWVKPRFYTARYDQKTTLLNVVYGYYYDDDRQMVFINDELSGKKVGQYSLMRGLEME